MFIFVNEHANDLPRKPENLSAVALQEGLGGQSGEMRTIMQYLFRNFNFRGNGIYENLKQKATETL
jgi:Mn-containing catalase